MSQGVMGSNVAAEDYVTFAMLPRDTSHAVSGKSAITNSPNYFVAI